MVDADADAADGGRTAERNTELLQGTNGQVDATSLHARGARVVGCGLVLGGLRDRERPPPLRRRRLRT
jgi:hypothetical protein